MIYSQFYRKHVARTLERLASPRVAAITDFEAPRNPIVHIVTGETSIVGPEPNDWRLAYHADNRYIHHVETMTDGSANKSLKTVPTTIGTAIANYTRGHRELTRVRNLERAVNMMDTMVVINYGFLGSLYRFPSNAAGAQNWALSINQTVYTQVAKCAEISDREQYIFLKVPTPLPTRRILSTYAKELKRSSYTVFNEPDILMFRDLYQWLARATIEDSNPLSKLSESKLNLVNVIMYSDTSFYAINLGHLLDDMVDADKVKPVTGGNPVQKRLLVGALAVNTANYVADGDEESTKPANPAPKSNGGAEGGTNPVEPSVSPGPRDTANEDEYEDNEINPTTQSFLRDESDDALDEALDAAETVAPLADDKQPQVIDYEPTTVDNGVERRLKEMLATGEISQLRYNKLIKNATLYKEIPNPFGEGKLVDFAQISEEEADIGSGFNVPEIKGIKDETIMHDRNKSYIEKSRQLLPKYICQNLLAIQKEGYALADVKVKTVSTRLDEYYDIEVKIITPKGDRQTWHIPIPIPDRDGMWRAGGANYITRIQRGDSPIRKVSPSRVALTSYRSKLMIDRSTRSQFNYTKWFSNQLKSIGLDSEDDRISKIRIGASTNPPDKVPFDYSTCTQSVQSMSANGCEFYFVYTDRLEHLKAEASIEGEGEVLCGKKGNNFLVMREDNTIVAKNKAGDIKEELDSLPEMLKIEEDTPLEMIEMNLLTKTIPVGIILAYYLSLDQMLALRKASYRRVPAGGRMNLTTHEYAVRFKDTSLIFDKRDRMTMMLMAGFVRYKRTVAHYELKEFNRKNVYLNLLQANNLSARYLSELDNLRNMFIDPVTERLLKSSGEPTEFTGLLFRATELLLTQNHNPEVTFQDGDQRLKQFDRWTGMMYEHLAKSIRRHRSTSISSSRALDFKPLDVWNSIVRDEAKLLVSEENPYSCVRNRETVTLSGHGGRGGRSMPLATRAYDVSDIGVMSEATADSSNVGVVAGLVYNADIKNAFGIVGKTDLSKLGQGYVYSSTGCTAPFIDNEDSKRAMFVGVQQAAGMHTDNYQVNPCTTGAEHTLPYKFGRNFYGYAEKDGKVTDVDEHAVTVEYTDGTVDHFEHGRLMGRSSGMYMPHTMLVDVKVGEKVKSGDTITYCKEFLEKSRTQKHRVICKTGIMGRVALVERKHTHEDSNAMTISFSNKFVADLTHTTIVTADQSQEITNMLDVGAKVEYDSILCTIQDQTGYSPTSKSSDETVELIQSLGNNNPPAKNHGVIERVDVFYNANIEDLSPTLAKLVKRADRRANARAKSLGKDGDFSGKVDSRFRVGGKAVSEGTVKFVFYITGKHNGGGTGEKYTFGNQLKSTSAEIVESLGVDEDGKPVDADFGGKSVGNRIVLGFTKAGLTATISRELFTKSCKLYWGN